MEGGSKMKVHYFYCRKDRGGFYDVTIKAILESDVYSRPHRCDEKSFRLIEEIHIFISTDMNRFHDSQFKIMFGKDSCHGFNETTVKSLHKRINEDHFHPSVSVTQLQYLRFRKVCFALYEREKQMNFELVAEPQKGSITVLIQ